MALNDEEVFKSLIDSRACSAVGQAIASAFADGAGGGTDERDKPDAEGAV